MSKDLRFHHIGLASRQIATEAAALEALGYRPESDPFVDPGQGIRGQFMVGGGPRLEVLEPIASSRTLEPWLAKGVKLYHQAFEVDDLDHEVSRHRDNGAIVVVPAIAATAFAGRRIAFLMLSNLLLVELIEAGN